MIVAYYFAAIRLAGSPRDQSSPPSTVSRTSLRRAIPSFRVEVRRRPRLTTNSSQELQSSETKTWAAAFGSESHRLAAVTFGAAEAPNRPSGEGAASPPKRRILPSLVLEQSPGAPLQDAFSSAATSDPVLRARKPSSASARKGRDHTSKLSRNLELSPELTAPLADRSLVGSVRASLSPSDETAVSSRVPKATANRFVGNSDDPALHKKAKRRVQIPSALDASPVPVSAKDQRSITPTDPFGALPTDSADVSQSNRKRTIMGRYVFGDELKPGERWKRRLSKRR